MRKIVCIQLSIYKGSILNSQPDSSYAVSTYCREMCLMNVCWLSFGSRHEGSQTLPKSSWKLFLMSNNNNILFLYSTFNARILGLYKHLPNNTCKLSVSGWWGNSTRCKNTEIKIEHRISTHNGLSIYCLHQPFKKNKNTEVSAG